MTEKARVTRLFTQSDLERIERAVETAERKTAGEIVTVVVPASSHYGFVHSLWALGGLLTASAGIAAATHWTEWEPHTFDILVWQLGGVIGALLASLWEPLFRLSLPRRYTARHVHREALAHFTATGVTATRHRTGILLFLSELEQRVEILADAGIHAKETPDFWSNEVRRIVEGIRAGKAAEGIIEAIASLTQRLAVHFPTESDDTNELGNRVRLGLQDIGR